MEKAAKENAAALSEINQPWVRRIIYIGIGIACFSQTTGVNSIIYYGSQVLNEAGFSRQASIIANTLNGLVSVIGTSGSIYLMKTMPRRRMFTIGFCITTFSLMGIAILAMTMEGNPVFPYLVLCCTVLFLFGMQGGVGPILWLSISEIIPLRFRGYGMGICVLFVWITNFVIGLFFPTLLASFGLASHVHYLRRNWLNFNNLYQIFCPRDYGKNFGANRTSIPQLQSRGDSVGRHYSSGALRFTRRSYKCRNGLR